jgi:hypothetical protein
LREAVVVGIRHLFIYTRILVIVESGVATLLLRRLVFTVVNLLITSSSLTRASSLLPLLHKHFKPAATGVHHCGLLSGQRPSRAKPVNRDCPADTIVAQVV